MDKLVTPCFDEVMYSVCKRIVGDENFIDNESIFNNGCYMINNEIIFCDLFEIIHLG